MTETRLATLTEAAEITDLSVDALRQRIKRRKLAAHRGNDGRVRVRRCQVER
jgi:predicted HTH domain antitoxin